MLVNSDTVKHSSLEHKVSSLNILFLNSPTQKQFIYNHIEEIKDKNLHVRTTEMMKSMPDKERT